MIEITQDEATKLAGIEFKDIHGGKYVFKDGAVLIISASRTRE